MSGARPQVDLLLAYRGTSAALRRVVVLAEHGFDGGGDDRVARVQRRVVAGLGYSARALAAHLAAIREGRPASLVGLLAERDDRVAAGVSLPARALRHLAEHAAVHLRVEWRDLPDHAWAEAQAEGLSPAALVRARGVETWTAAVALGGRPSDVPPAIRATVDPHAADLGYFAYLPDSAVT